MDGYYNYKLLYEKLHRDYIEKDKLLYKALFSEDINFVKVDYLRQESELLKYITILQEIKKQYLIIMAIKDTPGDVLTREESVAIKSLGFTNFSKSYRTMYIGIINKSQVIENRSGETEETPLSFIGKIDDDINVDVKSLAWQSGRQAKISINDIDYAVNMRGINIVVYDTEKQILVDSVAFDYFRENQRICSHGIK